jgi:hypothetical protein
MEARTLTSEWADWTDASIPDMDAVAERQRFEGYVSALWTEVKNAIVASIASVNGQLTADSRIDCANSPGGGLALTRWSQYPVAFLDVWIDPDAATFECLYSCAAREGDTYRELRKVWSIKSADGGLLVADERGDTVSSSDELARIVVEAYLANL